MIVERLFLAAVDSTLIAIAVLAISSLRVCSSRLTSLLWLAVLLKGLLTLAGAPPLHIALPQSAFLNGLVEVTCTPFRLAQAPDDYRTPLAAGWMIGCAVAALNMAARYARTTIALHASYRHMFRGQTVFVSNAVDAPALAGVFHPSILIPEWMVEIGDEELLAWSVRHELAHARSRDSLALLIADIAMVFLWFHPAAWLARGRWEDSAEIACDQQIARNERDAVEYADALQRTLTGVHRRQRLAAFAMVRRGSRIVRRVAILTGNAASTRSSNRWALVLVTLILLCALAVGSAIRRPEPAQIQESRQS